MAGDFVLMVVHFILTECRPVILLYFAYRTYLMDTIRFDATHTFEMPTQVERVTSKEMKLGDFLDCMRDDIESSLYTTSTEYAGGCVSISGAAHHMDLVVNGFAMFVGVMFVIVMTITLCLSSSRGFGSGRYVAFTLEMKSQLPYRIMAGIETLFVLYIFIRTCISVAADMEDGSSRNAKKFVDAYGSEILLLLYSAVALFSTHHPCFDYTDAEFHALEFQRGIGAVFSQTNGDFVKALELAVFKAEHGVPADLQAIVGSDSKLQQATIDAVLPVNPDGSGSEDDDNDSQKEEMLMFAAAGD